MHRMLILDRFKINQQKFNNSLGTSSYQHNLIIFPKMAYEMLIGSSCWPLKVLEKIRIKERIKITSIKTAQASNNQFLDTRSFKS